MDASLQKLKSTKTKLRKSCRVASIFLYAVLAFFILGIIVIAFLALGMPGDFTFTAPESQLATFAIVLETSCFVFSIFVMARLLGMVAKSGSPFSKTSSRLLIALGCLILVCVACKPFIDPSMTLGAVSENTQAVIDYESSGASTTFVDMRGILEATACFILAVIFRYGALLQKETDNLV